MTITKPVLLTCALALPSLALADDITDAVAEAMSAYHSGQYSEAVSQLDYASGLIRQKKAEAILAVFPEPLSGWSGDEPESQASGSMMMGGGISASRTYHRDNISVDISLVTDSPMLQSMMGMFNNPSLITMNGGKLIKIQGHKAMLTNTDNPQIILIVDGTAMLTLKASGASDEDLKDYGEALNLAAL